MPTVYSKNRYTYKRIMLRLATERDIYKNIALFDGDREAMEDGALSSNVRRNLLLMDSATLRFCAA